MSELSLETSRIISAPRARVFDAWLDPEMLAKFMMPGPNMSVPVSKTDPVEGGRFEVVMQSGDNQMPHGGVYKEISPYDRIVFTWESPFSIEGSTVTLRFSDAADGTEVTLTHVTFPSEEVRDNHEKGWTSILAALDAACAVATV